MTTRIAIAGGGPVGLALACACRGFDVHVIESAPQRPAAPASGYDPRIFALSAGSRALLRDLGAWEAMDARRIAAVRRMDVFGDRGAKLSFSARPGAALAWIVEAGRLAQALEEQAAASPGVRITRGTSAGAFQAGAAGASLQLQGGERIEADLLVGADGPDSRVRAALGLEASEQPYGETALVANFATQRPHGEAARQWFSQQGVLAYLPLPGNRISIVWSAPAALAAELAALPTREFEIRVRDAAGGALGDLALESAVGAYPLRLIRVNPIVAPGAALVGDAAHAVHPLAGQGVNLGFQDARVLAEVLACRSPLERAGDLQVLRRYERARREDVTSMQFVTDRLDRLFSDGSTGTAAFRNLGLRLVDSVPWAKDALATRAMR